MKAELLKYINNGNVHRLAGKHHAEVRQTIILIMTGIKLPLTRCGVTAVQTGLFEVANIKRSALICMEAELTEWLNS